MGITSFIAKRYAAFRINQLNKISANAVAVQEKLLRNLITTASITEFGKTHKFSTLKNYSDFKQQVPVRNYEEIKPWINKIVNGELDITWPGKPTYLSKTSGTTSGSKYIPNTAVSLQAQITAARDALLFYIYTTGNAKFLQGKMLFLSGSPVLVMNAAGIPVGRLSGIVNHKIPAYLKRNQIPKWETNCIEDWETKIDKIVSESIHQDLRLISGIPPWVQMFFEILQSKYGKTPMEVWPNLSVFVFGGVDFTPYAGLFKNQLSPTTDKIETFPASEGFFAVQDCHPSQGLRLLLDNGIYYEFIPMTEYGRANATRINIADVQLGVEYALIISTHAGLWAYDIGDTIRFISLFPHRIEITGRTSQFISAFGEHIIVREVNQAIQKACEICQVRIQEFTVMPKISDILSRHDWFIEFIDLPNDLLYFEQVLNECMCKQNIYYQDLITGKILHPLKVFPLKSGACTEYMKQAGKLGGQNKFPRIKNTEELRGFFEEYIIYI